MSTLQTIIKRHQKRILSPDEVMRIRGVPGWAKRIIRETADKHQEPVLKLLHPCRALGVVAARNEAIYLVKLTKSSVSTTQIGWWFNKDASTILYSVARHSEAAGLPSLTTYSLSRKRSHRK